MTALAHRLSPEPEAPRAPPVLFVSGLAKRFGARQILRDVTFEARPGEVTALIGANGTGKSTLLRSIVRLVEPDAGTVTVLDQEVRGLDRKALKAFRSRVGFVFQKHNLVGRLSVLTNVIHGVQARMSGPRTWHHALAPAPIRDEAMACLAAVGLADRALQRADSLSGGQSQRVAIARMLMQRPELVLADEPDASLDPRAGRALMELLYSLAHDKGLALVVISHRIEHTLAFSDRIVGLADGIVTLELDSRVAHAEQLRAFFERPPAETDGETANHG